MIDTTTRQPEEDEPLALEVIEAIEDVAGHRWLPEASHPMPDLEVTLCGGQVVAVEITLSTDGATRRLYSSFRREVVASSGLDVRMGLAVVGLRT